MDPSELDDELRLERQWRERSLQDASIEDLERLVRIFSQLDRQRRADLLREATRKLLSLAADPTARRHISEEELNQAAAERIESARPANELYDLARDAEPDIEGSFFPDGIEHVLFGPAAETYSWADSMVSTYNAVSREHPMLPSFQTHLSGTPADKKGTKWRHSKVVHEEATRYFADFLFEWRERLLSRLFEDLRPGHARLSERRKD